MDPQGPEPPDTSGSEQSAGRGPGTTDDALRRLEDQLSRASEAAERLIAEAAGEPPPSGWQVPHSEQESRASRDIEVLLAVLQSFRDLIPADLQRRLAEALRELLLAIRALIDWYLERVEQRRAAPSEPQDIPIL